MPRERDRGPVSCQDCPRRGDGKNARGERRRGECGHRESEQHVERRMERRGGLCDIREGGPEDVRERPGFVGCATIGVRHRRGFGSFRRLWAIGRCEGDVRDDRLGVAHARRDPRGAPRRLTVDDREPDGAGGRRGDVRAVAQRTARDAPVEAEAVRAAPRRNEEPPCVPADGRRPAAAGSRFDPRRSRGRRARRSACALGRRGRTTGPARGSRRSRSARTVRRRPSGWPTSPPAPRPRGTEAPGAPALPEPVPRGAPAQERAAGAAAVAGAAEPAAERGAPGAAPRQPSVRPPGRAGE